MKFLSISLLYLKNNKVFIYIINFLQIPKTEKHINIDTKTQELKSYKHKKASIYFTQKFK